MHRRGKMDLFATAVWLIILGVIGGVILWCVGNMRAVNDPRNRENYWRETMYPYRSGMERGDRLLEEGRFEEARRAYQDAIEGNSQSRVSLVLHDRIVRAHYREGLAQHEQGQCADAVATFRRAIDAQRRVADIDHNRQNSSTDPRFRGDVTSSDQLGDALAASLVADGVQRRDDLQNPETARTALEEARRLRPHLLSASRELITLHTQTRHTSPLLEAMRHVIDNFPGPGTPEFDSADADYQRYRTAVEEQHRLLQTYILENYPVEGWVPMVDGLTLQYHSVFAGLDGSEIRGGDFTRTVQVVAPGVAQICRTPGSPDFILRWSQVPGVGDCLVEEWTSSVTDSQPRVYHLLPRQPQMGMRWRNADGREFQIVDLRSHPEHEFRLFIAGWELTHVMPIMIDYGVGRVSVTPRGEGEGEYLDNALTP